MSVPNSPLNAITVTSTVNLDRYHAQPLTMAQAIDLIDQDGFLVTVISLDIDALIEMRTDNEALNNDYDIYTDLAALQVQGGDAYDSSYSVKAFDPATAEVYVEVSNGLREMLEDSRGFDLSTVEGRAEAIADFDG